MNKWNCVEFIVDKVVLNHFYFVNVHLVIIDINALHFKILKKNFSTLCLSLHGVLRNISLSIVVIGYCLTRQNSLRKQNSTPASKTIQNCIAIMTWDYSAPNLTSLKQVWAPKILYHSIVCILLYNYVNYACQIL